MIRLFQCPGVDRCAESADLLAWADGMIQNELATAVEIRLAGVAARMAFEFYLAELCREHGPPKGEKWHHFALRLMKAGIFTMGDYRKARRIARVASKAVHGKPFGVERAEELFEAVSGFIQSQDSEIE